MSSDLPEFSPASPLWERDDTGLDVYVRDPGPAPREWIISGILLAVTFLSTSFAGLFYIEDDVGFFEAFIAVLRNPGLLLYGLPFSVPLIAILLAHELGHYAVCRHYGMRCTPPFFLPAPISIVGTLGAFIKIKSAFRSKHALFDIGIAGPLAGFVFAIPALWIGISLSDLIPRAAPGQGGVSFGEPILFRLIGILTLGYNPGRQDMIAHPIAMAGWVGLLATSLNLLPIWQLDGGHIAYAILGPAHQKKLSKIAVVALILLSLFGWPIPSYFLFGVLLLLIGARTHFYHPATLNDEVALGRGRLFLGAIALLILILSFTPVPISIT